MRLLANENISKTVIATLRERGHDVLAAKESMRGDRDRAVLARAQAEKRLVVTCDKDFGELAYHSKLPAECGVILFRLASTDSAADNRRMLEVLESPMEWAGHFAVADERRVRLRPLPTKVREVRS